MSNNTENLPVKPAGDSLFDRVASILEQAKGNVVRSVNANMVLAYWLIGCEIVQELQAGEERATYGEQLIESLSSNLTKQYGRGFSAANLKNFRQFYQAFPDRIDKISYLLGSQLAAETDVPLPVFSPLLTWSHYRALMRVQNVTARNFYEQEAIECGWSKAQLERQIQSAYYQRILANHGNKMPTRHEREQLPGERITASQIIKSPYIMEFLDLPDTPALHESDLEQAIINNLQAFLLELGKGFSFVARQKHIRFEDDDFYVDLVFYNYMLKCFLLIDLKLGKLTHRDVGQMDGYVRLFEDRFKVAGDNPTIGLILCSDKSEAVAKYSVLSEGHQIFASKYLQFLPSEQELKLEIEKERRLLEVALDKA